MCCVSYMQCWWCSVYWKKERTVRNGSVNGSGKVMWILVWEDHVPLQVQPVCQVSIFWQVGGLVLLYSACCWRDVWLAFGYSSHLVEIVSAFCFRSKNFNCRIIREILSRHKDWLFRQLSFRHEMKEFSTQ